MTVALSYKTSDGCYIVADKRVCQDASILTDGFTKVRAIGPLVIAIAGEIGAASRWLRAAERESVETFDDLVDLCQGGDYGSSVYDASTHTLYQGDAAGAFIAVERLAAIGAGADYCRGFLEAAGVPAGQEAALLTTAVEHCARTNLSVSHETDLSYVSRLASATSRRRAKRPQRNDRPSRGEQHLSARRRVAPGTTARTSRRA